MNTQPLRTANRIADLLRSLLLVCTGLCLIFACVSIYRSGPQPFSRAAVEAAFSSIALPVYLCLGLILLGFVWDLLHAGQAREPAPEQLDFVLLKRMLRRRDPGAADPQLRQQIRRLQLRRRNRRLLAGAVCGLCGIIFLGYSLNGSHFSQDDITGSVIAMMGVLGPSMAIGFSFCLYTAYRNRPDRLAEAELLKQCPKGHAPESTGKKDRTGAVRVLILGTALCLILAGLLLGGTADVLTKAINICTECIGLG